MVIYLVAMAKGLLKLADELNRSSQPINEAELRRYTEALLNTAQTVDNLSQELVG